MPYTKRIPVHAGERGTGLYNAWSMYAMEIRQRMGFW